MPKKKSVFSEEEKEEIVINQIIFHIIVTEEAEPRYTEGIIGLDEEQKTFWKKHLIIASEGRQCKFTEGSKDNLNFITLEADVSNSLIKDIVISKINNSVIIQPSEHHIRLI